MAHGRLLSLRLFLEGVEVPCVSAKVTCGVSMPATAEIEVPYAKAARELLPRTLVHLFFLETTYASGKKDEQTRLAVGDFDETSPGEWKLLFAGELLRVAFNKTGGARANFLVCQDFSSYWQAAQLYWGTGNNSANMYKKIMFMGATQVTTGAAKVRSGGALANLLAAKPTSIPTLPGVLGGIVSLLEAATGVYGKNGKYRGVNDFLSQAEVRLHLSRMIGAHPKDDTSDMYLKYGDLGAYFRRLTSSVQSTSSFMDLANTYLSKIQHVWASVAAPPFIPGGTQLVVRQALPVSKVAAFNKELGVWAKRIQDSLEVTYEHQSASISNPKSAKDTGADVGLVELKNAGVNGEVVPRTEAHEKFVSKLASAGLLDTASVSSASTSALSRTQAELQEFSQRLYKDLSKRAPGRSNTRVTGALARVTDAMYDMQALAKKEPDGTYKNQTQANVDALYKKLSEAAAELGAGLSIPMVVKSTVVSTESRLAAFLFIPDLYMVPPPTCNVLFPDQYVSAHFSRSWLDEPTRLWMFGQTSAGSETSTGYFAPNTAILSGPSAADAATAVASGTSFLMPHEIYTGPVPALQTIGDIGVFRRIHAQQIADSKKEDNSKVADKFGSKFTGQARYSPQEHLQRAANYLFFAKRFEARSMQVEAKFSPQVVPGLPVLLLDPADGSAGFTVTDAGPAVGHTGQHYVGLAAQVVHNINVNGASTSILMSKCRYHDEGVDIFGEPDVNTGAVYYRKRIVRYAKVVKPLKQQHAGYVESLRNPDFIDPVKELIATGALGKRVASDGVMLVDTSFEDDPSTKYEKRISTIKDVKTSKRYEVIVREADLTDADVKGFDKPKNNFVPVFAGPTNSTEAAEAKARAEYNFSDQVSSRKYVIEVSHVDKRVDYKPLKFTFEGTTTPPWFSDVYLPSKVGPQFYQYMLGCQSVVDEPLLEAQNTSGGSDLDATRVYSMPTATGTREVELPAEFSMPAASTYQAAELLAELWTGLRAAEANIPLFVEAFTQRRYATMLDILGDRNPWLRTRIQSNQDDSTGMLGTTVGFHGNAYGNLRNMEDFDGGSLEEEPTVPRMPVTGVKPPVLRKISPDADPRAVRYTRVTDYAEEVRQAKTTGGL